MSIIEILDEVQESLCCHLVVGIGVGIGVGFSIYKLIDYTFRAAKAEEKMD